MKSSRWARVFVLLLVYAANATEVVQERPLPQEDGIEVMVGNLPVDIVTIQSRSLPSRVPTVHEC